MKQLLVALTLVASTSAMAECYIRSDIRLSSQKIHIKPTDVQSVVTPEGSGHRCVSRYRVYTDQWITAEGSAVAKTQALACQQAEDIGRGYVLAEVTPNQISATNQMVCSDLPDIRVRPVKRGETVWESETDLHSHPLERANPYFKIKQARCRKFIERTALHQNLIIYQGVICQATTDPKSQWIVLDKY